MYIIYLILIVLMESEGLPYEEENFLNNNTIIEFFDKNFVREVSDLTTLNRTD